MPAWNRRPGRRRGAAIRARIRAWEHERAEERRERRGVPSGKAAKILRGQIKRVDGAQGHIRLRSR